MLCVNEDLSVSEGKTVILILNNALSESLVMGFGITAIHFVPGKSHEAL